MGSASFLRLFWDFTGDLTAGLLKLQWKSEIDNDMCTNLSLFVLELFSPSTSRKLDSSDTSITSFCCGVKLSLSLGLPAPSILHILLSVTCTFVAVLKCYSYTHVTSYVLTFYAWWSLLRSPSNDRIPTPYVLHQHQYLWVFLSFYAPWYIALLKLSIVY